MTLEKFRELPQETKEMTVVEFERLYRFAKLYLRAWQTVKKGAKT